MLYAQVSRTKEKLYEYQEELERQHREEEDRLMAQFHQERLTEAENMQKEFDSEWEQQLKALTDHHKKKDKVPRRTDVCVVTQQGCGLKKLKNVRIWGAYYTLGAPTHVLCQKLYEVKVAKS